MSAPWPSWLRLLFGSFAAGSRATWISGGRRSGLVIPTHRMGCRRSMTGARGTASSAGSAQARHAPPDKVRNGAALKPAGSTDGGRRRSGRGQWKRRLEQATGAGKWGSARTFGVEPTVKIGRKTARSRSPPPGVAGFPQAGRARIFSRAAGAHATLKRLADR